MARAFSRGDAAGLIKEHSELLEDLYYASECQARYKNDVMSAARALIDQEVLKVLKDIPVDELTRVRRGLKVKSLHDAGYNDLSDIYKANTYNLVSVNGISEEGATAIKNAADEYAAQAAKDTRIRLSVDSRTPKNTALVAALFKYRSGLSMSKKAVELLQNHEGQIRSDIQRLEGALGFFKWLFAGSSRKKSAEDSFVRLRELLTLQYGEDAKAVSYLIHRTDEENGRIAWQDFSEKSIEYFTTLEEICPGILGNDDGIYGLPDELVEEIEKEELYTDGLLCTLRRYQELGVRYILHQGKVLLGDEMGLGKTVQAIAAMVSLSKTGATHFAVVCPASVITNWCREIRKHSRLPVIKVHGPERLRALEAWKQSGGVAVTTYETTRYFTLEEEFSFSMLIVDEAHYIKNPKALRTQNVIRMSEHAERLLFMTGTALENRVDEMIALIEILQPDMAEMVRSKAYMASAPQFRELVAPVYFRRKRDQVLTELPELIENREWCTMTPEEEAVYEDTLYSGNFMAVRRVSWNVSDLGYSSKAKRLLEIVEDAKEDGRKVIVFSYFLDTIASVQKLLGDVCTEPIVGSVSSQRRQEIIDEFENAEAGAVLPAQIQSGGTGLNIQSASVVIICEPQYKPSIENQAISRAYRMGQTRNVLVYRLLCEDSVDERILTILERKKQEFNAFADESTAGGESIALSEEAFGDIIQEEIDRINLKRKNEDPDKRKTEYRVEKAEAGVTEAFPESDFDRKKRLSFGSGRTYYVYKDDEAYIAVEVDYFESFSDAVIFGDYLVIGNYYLGLIVIELGSLSSRSLRLSGYFGSFMINRNDLYVFGCENVIKFDRQMQMVWMSDPIAIDGTIFRGFDGSTMVVSCEMDPPDGWVEKRISLMTGKEII